MTTAPLPPAAATPPKGSRSEAVWPRYGVAVLSTAAAMLARVRLHAIVADDATMLYFVGATVLSAYVGGLGPGLLATGLGAIAAGYFFLEPSYSFGVTRTPDRVEMLLLLAIGTLISLMSGAFHRSRRRATAAIAAEALAESNRRIAAILHSITDCYYAIDNDWRITEVNRQAAAYFGKDRDDILNRVFWDVFPGAIGSTVERRYRRAMAEQSPAHFETPSVAVPGRWAEIHAYPSLVGLNVYFREITERKKAELRDALLRGVIRQAPVGIAFFDRDLRYVQVNDFAAGLTGHAPDELIGRTFAESVGASFGSSAAEDVVGQLRNALETGNAPGARSLSMGRRGPNGSLLTIDWEARRIDGEDGEPLGVLMTIADVTRHELAKWALAESEDRLRLAIEAGNLGTWDTDLATGEATYSDRSRAVLGLPPDGPLRHDSLFSRLHPDDRELASQTMRAAIDPAGKGDFRVEFRVLWPDDSVRWIAARGRVHFRGAGAGRHAARFVGTAMDITDHKRTEEQLRHSQERFRHLLDISTVGIVIDDPRDPTPLVNAALLRVLGCDRTCAHPLDLSPLGPPDGHDGEGVPREVELRACDGRMVPVLVGRAVLERTAGGEPVVVSFVTDLTDQKRAERACREVADRLDEAVEAAGLGSWRLDPSTGAMECSDAFKTILGLPIDASPPYEAVLTRIHPDDRDTVHRALLRAIHPEGPGRFEARYRIGVDDEASFWVLGRGRASFEETPDGRRAVRFVGTLLREQLD